MKKYVERYIYDVVRRLPKEMQDEVSEELSSNIYDMLEENPTEEEIDRVLHELGSPRKIANNYKEDKRYVISPLFYEDYIRVLKLALIIGLGISLVISSIDSIINVNEATLFATLFYVIGRVLEGLGSMFVLVFFFVTVIFWIVDRYHVNVPKDDWKIKDLPDLPDVKTSKIPRTGSIVSLVFYTIFTVIFIIILLRYVDVIGWYQSGVLIANLFDKGIVDQFIVFFIISVAIGFMVHLLKIYYQRWNKELAIIYTFSSILSLVLMLLFINQSDLVTHAFFFKLANTMDTTIAYLKNGLRNIVIWVSVIASVVTAIDLTSIWLKTLRPKQIKEKKST